MGQGPTCRPGPAQPLFRAALLSARIQAEPLRPGTPVSLLFPAAGLRPRMAPNASVGGSGEGLLGQKDFGGKTGVWAG